MSLTLLNRPIGHRLNDTLVDAVIIDDGTGDALVYTEVAHLLSDGDYVYIESNFDSYNGFKYVDSIAYDSFKIRSSEAGSYVDYVQDATIQYRTSVLNHGWQAVHLPIVYELESDLWPNNVAEEAYTPTTIVSQADENGNTLLNLSVGIAGATALNFIELVGDSDLAGPYQILQVDNPWAIVINLAYDATNDFSGLQVVNYYNNYAINVEVWAGLDAGHRWAANKPYELAATLKFIPDSEGKIKFSIADILKGYITTRNNLTLDTLPNNLDFHVSFYIKYYESYDQSDGEDITTFEGPVTTDTFQGHAVNSMMPFKSLHSGHMSEYVNQDTNHSRWLTLFDRPLLVVGRFWDISFILQYNALDLTVTIEKSLNGVVTATEIMTILNPGLGIIRIPIIPESGFDQYCIQVSAGGANSFPLSSFLNQAGAGYDWTTGSAPIVNLVGAGTSDWLYLDFDFTDGATYLITTNYDATAVAAGGFLGAIMDEDFNILESVSTDSAGGGNKNNVLPFVATADAKKLAFRVSGLAHQVTINAIIYTITGGIQTEQICCDVVDECSPTFVDDILRITEASQARIIE